MGEKLPENKSFFKWFKRYMHKNWYKCPKTRLVALSLIEDYQYKDGIYKGIKLKLGQILISQTKIADKCGLTRQQVRTCIDKLIKEGFIEKHGGAIATKRGMLLTLLDYDFYELQDLPEQPRKQKINQENNQFNNHENESVLFNGGNENETIQ